jgi:hypothetical protein
MKQILLLCVLLGSILNAQNKDIPIPKSDVKTTYEEYNYLTEVYPRSDNLKMLDGYALEDFFEFQIDKYNFAYKNFIKKETGEVKAVFIILSKLKKKEDKKRYICIPFNNSELFKRFYLDSVSLGLSMGDGFDFTNSALLAILLDHYFNIENAPNKAPKN